MAFDGDVRVAAVLGPTNTGKTHYAIERMLGHRTGVIGLPLRLLAREVYDRIVSLRGPSVVALVTGEERIVPPRAAYWVCTVEAMPVGLAPEFLAVDEIQLAGDAERGHIFTDRLLNARGLSETLFLGAETIRPRIASLVPGVRFMRRERFSRLAYTGARKISRLPPRSAVVGFSAGDVYAIAELLRRQKGGAAVVMGALSPRTRNAQVALFQNGDVDHLVATDAIGMGLNLDIAHVAFSGLVKFDGRRHRHLGPSELAQIAGRAGRYATDGTFGVTGEAPPLDADLVAAIEESRFAPLRRLQWRNDRLDFAGPDALIASLQAGSQHPELAKASDASDLLTLRVLSETPGVRGRVQGPRDVRLLWDVCQIPDFRKVSPVEHANLCTRLHEFLHDGGTVPPDWLARQIARIDRTDADIDALSTRLAYIRTWTYVAQRKGWVADADHWRDETRAVEDRLSDALHARLTQRFVDRRTSVLMRRLKQREGLVASVTETGEVSIDGHSVGRLEGFRFRLDPTADADQIRTLRSAAFAALAPVLSLRADKVYNAPDTEFDITEQGGLMWGEHALGKLVAGPDPLSPQVEVFVDEDAAPEISEKLRRRLGHFVDRRIAAQFEPLIALRDDAALSGMARGIAFRLVEALGVLPRAEIADEVKGLDQESRAGLRKHGVRFGQHTVFLPLLLKPAPTRLRLVLWSLADGLSEFPQSPPPGLVTVPALADAPKGYYARAGYRLAGERAIRIDMLERLADMIRPLDARTGFEASAEMLSISGLTLEQFARLMQGLGFQAASGTRHKAKPPAPESAAAAPDPGGASAETGAGETPPAPKTNPAEPAPAAPESMPPESMPPEAPVPLPASPDGASLETAGEPPASPEPVAAPPSPAVAESALPEPVSDESESLAPARPDALGPLPATESGPAPEAVASGATEETEVFFVFTRGPRRPREARKGGAGAKPAGRSKARKSDAGREKANEPRAGGKPGSGPRRPAKADKPIDPDNPFAALMALKLNE